MDWSTIRHEFKRNKTINLALLLFMMFSAILAVASVLLAVQTFTSISTLYETAQPPHFLQMHKGEIDEGQIDQFMAENELVTYNQTVTMIDIFGENLTVVSAGADADEKGSYSLSDLRLDIGLVKQNETKDLLLDSNHKKVVLNAGEIGMPVILKGMYEMNIGDRVILTANGIRKEFVIKEFVLDAQMNSTMTSSTRVLLSDADFEELHGKVGEFEYLIEAYLNDKSDASAFQTAYENGGLPINGQAVTYTILFLLSALTDIVTVFVLILASLLLIIVSFICVKFTIMAALEEEVREIGTMKAIGLPFADIRDLYLNKYRVLALIGVISGYIIALLSSNVITRHISTTFGDISLSPLAIILSILVAGLAYLLINHYCRKTLKEIKKLSVVDALISDKGFEKNTGAIKDGLHKSKRLPVNWLIGTREVFHKFKNWIVVFAVMLIAVMMIMVPVNLLNTLEAPEFITYMGSSLEDILIEVENGANLETNYDHVKQLLDGDDAIANYHEYRTVRVQTADVAGNQMNVDIDVGANAGNELQYLTGQAPQGQNELAISLINADELGIEVGSTIELFLNDHEQAQQFTVSGVYQDVTSGGKTAKSKNSFAGLAAHEYSFSVDLNENMDAKDKADEWARILGTGVTVDPMEEFIDQTLGGVSRQLRTIVGAIGIMGACLAILITVLFLKLRLAKDLSEIAVLKAIGFSVQDLNQQYLIKIGLAALLGIMAGTTATELLGEKIVNASTGMAGLGIKRVDLIANPVMAYIIVPLLLLGLTLLATRIVMQAINRYDIIAIINE